LERQSANLWRAHATPTFPHTFVTTDSAIRLTCTCRCPLASVIRQVRVGHQSVGCRHLYRWLLIPYPARLHLRQNVCRTCKNDRGSTKARQHCSRIDTLRTGNTQCTLHSRLNRRKWARNRIGPTTRCRVVNLKSCIRTGCTHLCIDATSLIAKSAKRPGANDLSIELRFSWGA
jgi:hypothetical protein